MRKNFGAALSALLIVLCTSCGGLSEEERKLGEADMVMIDFPDSAYSIIEGIDTLRLKGSRERAIYAALRAQSRYKTDRGIDNTGRLRDAAGTLAAEGENHYAMIAEYYIACDERGRGNDMEGMRHLLNAEQLAKELGDSMHLGLIYWDMAEIYNNVYSHANELEYARRAYECFKSTGREKYVLYALDLLSLVYNNNAMYDKAISLADSMRQLVPNDIELLGRAYSQIGLAKIGKRDYRGAVEVYLEKMNLNSGTMTVDDMNRLGLSYSHLGKLDSAEIFYKITLSSVDSSSVSMSYFMRESKTMKTPISQLKE